MKHVRRSLLDIVISRIELDQVIALTGARQTGKTTFCELQLPQHLDLPFTYVSFDDPDERRRFQKAAVSILESMDTPLVILDEVQKVPAIFDPLKLVVDRQKRKKPAERRIFALTGSSQLLLMKNIRETLAGRIAMFHMYPFSLSEVAEQPQLPFLTQIWRQRTINASDVMRFNALSPQLLRPLMRNRDEHQAWGGYPPVWQRKDSPDKLNWLKDYRKTYLERDISDVGQVADIDAFAMAQKLLCARTANILSVSEVARDLGLAVNTVKRYLQLLTVSFQCFPLQPWHTNVGKRLIKSPKIYFPDVGLNKAILGEMSVSHGATYETWAFAELVKWKQLQAVEPELFFYRTSAGMEIDFLIAGEGAILPIEAKANNKVGAADGRSLEAFMKDYPDTAKVGIIAYQGNDIAEIRKNIWAVPDWYLFGGL